MKRSSRARWDRHIDALACMVGRELAPPLLVLPSIPASMRLVEALLESMPVRIIGNPALMAQWSPSLAAHTGTALSLYREAKNHETLPWAVVSFPDQLVGVDPSYRKLDLGGTTGIFSIIEIMLLMRFHPPALVGAAIAGGHRDSNSRLELRRFSGRVPADLTAATLDAALLELMAPILACQTGNLCDWYARDVFALKLGDSFDRLLALKLLEIEGLLRVSMGQDATAAPLLDAVVLDRKHQLRRLGRAPVTTTATPPAGPACVTPNVPGLLYAATPDWLLAADRLRPVLGFRWPRGMAAPPPAELGPFERYDATALGHRIRTRRLQTDVFSVQPEQLDTYVGKHVIADVDALRGWMQAGSGAIFAVPHYGPFLAGAMLFASLGSPDNPSHVFYDPPGAVPENERFDLLFERFAGRLNVLHNEPRDLVKASRALRQKQCISIMFDVVQRPTDSLFVPFCGRLYPAMGGSAYLSLQSGAPIIPSYVLPAEGRRARVVFGRPILPQTFTSPDREQNIHAMTCALFRDFEAQLVAAPWHWIYWANVAAAPRFDAALAQDPGLLLADIHRRVKGTPGLLDAAPTLGALLRAPQPAPGPARSVGTGSPAEFA